LAARSCAMGVQTGCVGRQLFRSAAFGPGQPALHTCPLSLRRSFAVFVERSASCSAQARLDARVEQLRLQESASIKRERQLRIRHVLASYRRGPLRPEKIATGCFLVSPMQIEAAKVLVARVAVAMAHDISRAFSPVLRNEDADQDLAQCRARLAALREPPIFGLPNGPGFSSEGPPPALQHAQTADPQRPCSLSQRCGSAYAAAVSGHRGPSSVATPI
jgi:hypothetical protein